MKYLGKIKNRYADDTISQPEDLWVNKNYRISADGGKWTPIKSYSSLCIASVIELAITSEIKMTTPNEDESATVNKIISAHLNEVQPKDFVTPRKIGTLPTGYILNSKKIVHPHHSYYDPEMENNFHIWSEGRCYYWGVEIEARYTGYGEGTPQIRPCEHVGPKLHVILQELPLL
jgi:hypothetical protein